MSLTTTTAAASRRRTRSPSPSPSTRCVRRRLSPTTNSTTTTHPTVTALPFRPLHPAPLSPPLFSPLAIPRYLPSRMQTHREDAQVTITRNPHYRPGAAAYFAARAERVGMEHCALATAGEGDDDEQPAEEAEVDLSVPVDGEVQQLLLEVYDDSASASPAGSTTLTPSATPSASPRESPNDSSREGYGSSSALGLDNMPRCPRQERWAAVRRRVQDVQARRRAGRREELSERDRAALFAAIGL